MTPAEIRDLVELLAVNLADAARTNNQFVYIATQLQVKRVLQEKIPDQLEEPKADTPS
jgi:hypothetical protein